MVSATSQILILGHDQTLARTLSRLLTENGYATTSLSSSEAITFHLTDHAVDLILVDLALTGRDGFSVLEMLRRSPRHRDLPILALTEQHLEGTSVRALGLGATDVITKPIRSQELLARIRVHLRTGRSLNLARAEARSQSTLVELLKEINTDLPAQDLFQLLVRRVAAGLRIPRCSILFGRPGSELVTVAAASEDPMLHDLQVDLARYPEIHRALDSGEVVLVQDTAADPMFQFLGKLETTSSLVIPFAIRGEWAGVFFLRTGPGDPPLDESDLRFAAKVAESAAAAIAKALEREDSARREVAMRKLAETDPLTGLLNRRAFDERLVKEVERAARDGTVLTCVMLDIDHFKRTNDTHGHLVGDRILVQFAELLRREQRSMDVVARYGGEEFVVLLPETGSAGARLFAERMLLRVAATPFGEPDTPVSVTISLGLATFPDQRAPNGEALVRLADQNLFRAKGEGRNRYRD